MRSQEPRAVGFPNGLSGRPADQKGYKPCLKSKSREELHCMTQIWKYVKLQQHHTFRTWLIVRSTCAAPSWPTPAECWQPGRRRPLQDHAEERSGYHCDCGDGLGRRALHGPQGPGYPEAHALPPDRPGRQRRPASRVVFVVRYILTTYN